MIYNLKDNSGSYQLPKTELERKQNYDSKGTGLQCEPPATLNRQLFHTYIRRKNYSRRPNT